MNGALKVPNSRIPVAACTRCLGGLKCFSVTGLRNFLSGLCSWKYTPFMASNFHPSGSFSAGVFSHVSYDLLHRFSSIQITRNQAEKKMWLSQEAYVRKLLEDLGMEQCHGMDTPMEQGLQLTKASDGYQAKQEVIQWYQTVVGKLMYLLANTRYDIAYAGGTVARYSSNPTPEHVKAVIRIVRYLKKYPSLGIMFDGKEPLILWGTVDSGWGEDLDTRKSVYGYMFFLAGGVISQCSKRQPTIALSSAEAEYYTAKEAAKEAIWLRALLKELGYEQKTATTLLSDSASAIALASNPEHHARTKHVDIQTHWIRQVVASQEVDLKWVSTKDQLADGLTKPLKRIMYQSFVRRTGMVDR